MVKALEKKVSRLKLGIISGLIALMSTACPSARTPLKYYTPSGEIESGIICCDELKCGSRGYDFCSTDGTETDGRIVYQTCHCYNKSEPSSGYQRRPTFRLRSSDYFCNSPRCGDDSKPARDTNNFNPPGWLNRW